MPKKTIREMSDVERKRHSLARKAFRSTIVGALVLGLAALIIGLGIYTYTLIHQYITEAFNLSKSAVAIMHEIVDTEPLSKDVLTAYREQSESEREQSGTPEYRERFAHFTEREDYRSIHRVLRDLAEAIEVDALYMAMYDRETNALVYIVDQDENPETVVMPCDWDPVTKEGLEHFLDWDGEGELYLIENTPNYGLLCTSGMPIKNAEGETVAFILTDISFSNVANGMREFLILYVTCMLLLIILVAFLMARHTRKTQVEPINSITEAAENYVKDRLNGEKETEHFSKLNIHTRDEIENLSLIMADMEHELRDYEEQITKITAHKQQMLAEMTLASKIQNNMLPKSFPAFPGRSDFDIYASMDPARDVGGDFYDYFLIDDDHLCLTIADVSGKGIPAALFMMASKIILANSAKLGKSPAQILTNANATIRTNNQEDMFITVWLGILELSTGKLTAANAGHELPALMQNRRGFRLFKDSHGFVLGGMDGIQYKEYEIRMRPGAKLFLYTDGVPEATDANGELFGTKRMVAALNSDPSVSPEQIVKNIRTAVDDFVKDAEQFDDLTMLCIEYKGDHSE